MQTELPKTHKRGPRETESPIPSLLHSHSTLHSIHTMTSYSIDEYKSVGERGAYRNALLADEARRAQISSPTNSRTVIEETTVTPPPVMIPSTDMIREMAEDRFLEFTEDLAATVVE